MDSEVYAIAQEIMEGSGEQLFDHIAKCLADFVRDRNLQDETKTLPLGFTFRSTSKQSTCVGKHKDDECLQLPVQAGGAGRGQAHQLDKGLQMFGRGGGGCGHAAEAGAAQAGRCLHRGEVPPRPVTSTSASTSARSALS